MGSLVKLFTNNQYEEINKYIVACYLMKDMENDEILASTLRSAAL